MADNTVLNTGTGGDTIATDDIGGVKHQLVKVEFGAADSVTQVSTANPFPVSDSGGSLTVDNGGTFAVQIAANSSVNVAQVAGTTTDTNSGVKSAGTQRVVLATDQPALTNALKVDGSAVTQPVSLSTLPVTNAGTFAVQIAANSSVNNAQVSGTATSVNSGVKDAGTQRVILASDQTVVPISDNSGSLTVDAPVGTPAFVRLSDGAAAITALPVTDNGGSLTVDGTVTANLGTAAVTNAGTFVVQDSEKIADDAAFGVASTKLMPVGFLADQASTDSVNEGDIGAARITLDRKQIVTIGPSADTEGWTPSMVISAASTNATSVKGSAGKVGLITVSNINAAVRYLKLYNKATAPTVGTDVPVQVYAIPGNTAGAGTNIPIPDAGLTFGTGIAFALTTGVATADTGAVAANEIVVNLGTV